MEMKTFSAGALHGLHAGGPLASICRKTQNNLKLQWGEIKMRLNGRARRLMAGRDSAYSL